MNKEYMYISDEEIVVANENGKLHKRNIEASDMERLLQVENRLEYVNSIINKIESYFEKSEKNKEIYFSHLFNKILRLAYFVFVIVSSAVLLSVTFSSGKIMLGLCSFAILETLVILNYKYAMKTLINDYNEKLKTKMGLSKELEKAKELKSKYEKEIKYLKSTEYDKQVTQKNTAIISLENSMNHLPEEDLKQLDSAYEEGYQSSPKQLVLKYKNK